jgi:hypothetical protein
MRTIALLAVLAVTALDAGPNTAMKVAVVDPGCEIAVRMEQRACPPMVLCDITVDLPSPGYDLLKPKATVDHKAKRIRIEMRATPKPGGGAWPAVMTPTKTTAAIGPLAKGRYVVEIHYAVGAGTPLRPHHVFLLDAL